MKILLFIKIAFFSLYCLTNIHAQGKSDFNYKIIFGNILKLGEAKIIFRKKRDLYQIKMRIIPTGIAGFLSGHKEEYFESIGKIKNEALLPEYYIRERKTGDINYKSIHQFNHEKKEIKLTEFEINQKSKESKTLKDSVLLKFYVLNDVLSSFFNLGMKSQQSNLKSKHFSYDTLTLGEDKNRINVSLLKQNSHETEIKIELFEYDRDKDRLYDKKEFFLNMGKQSEFKKITIKNLFWLGNLEGILL